MGFNLDSNSILLIDTPYELQVGKTYPFEKAGSRLLLDTIPVWLTDSDWRVLAEISVLSQTRERGRLRGEFRVDYRYEGQEQSVINAMFVRMYAGLSDPHIYLLSSRAEADAAMARGELTRPSLDAEGFIHASPRSQLQRVANKFYREVEEVVVLVVDKAAVRSPVEWEPATGGLYPHIYGALNMDAVRRVVPIAPAAQGGFAIDPASLWIGITRNPPEGSQ